MSSLELTYRSSLLLICWLALLYLYLLASKREKSFLNILTPFVLVFSIRNYFLEGWRLFRTEPWGSDTSFTMVVLTSTIQAAALIIGFMVIRKDLSLRFFQIKKASKSYWLESLIFLALAIFAFLPIYREFGLLVILDPRAVYIQTRTGWGLSYFLSSFFVYFSLLFTLFSITPKKTNIALVICFYSILLFALGSKGKILGAWMMVFFWYLKTFQPRFSAKISLVVLAASLPLAAIFISTFTTGESNNQGGTLTKIDYASLYSDYNKNEALVLDDNFDIEFGRIFFEDYVVSKIPRTLYPEKPKDFGQFSLAKKYYPDWFYGDTGSPSFGKASYFVDFGYLAILIIPLVSFLSGCVLSLLWNNSKVTKDPYNFSLFLLSNGVAFLAAGAGSFTIETLIIITILFYMRYHYISKPKLAALRTSTPA
ncbi:hypothetical protein [Pseudomonas sp. ML2-2023-3]|uniref:hypothetical protein n=1 Tax=Pseudomonas sp. ML2-2023-3 TaxID=3122375 RepID=UPI0030D238EB